MRMATRLGSTIVSPMHTTSVATAGAVRRCRKIAHSSTKPRAGASTRTESTKAGSIPQPQASTALK